MDPLKHHRRCSRLPLKEMHPGPRHSCVTLTSQDIIQSCFDSLRGNGHLLQLADWEINSTV